MSLNPDLIKKFTGLLKISKKVTRKDLCNLLTIPEDEIIKYLVEWGNIFKFKLDGDYIIAEENEITYSQAELEYLSTIEGTIITNDIANSFLFDFDNLFKTQYNLILNEPIQKVPAVLTNEQKKKWDQIINNARYYAKFRDKKENWELLFADIIALANECKAPEILYYNAGFYATLIKNYDLALKYFALSNQISENNESLINYIYLALKENHLVEAVKKLIKYFSTNRISSHKLLWFLFSELAIRFDGLIIFKEIKKLKIENKDDWLLLLKTIGYLFHYKDNINYRDKIIRISLKNPLNLDFTRRIITELIEQLPIISSAEFTRNLKNQDISQKINLQVPDIFNLQKWNQILSDNKTKQNLKPSLKKSPDYISKVSSIKSKTTIESDKSGKESGKVIRYSIKNKSGEIKDKKGELYQFLIDDILSSELLTEIQTQVSNNKNVVHVIFVPETFNGKSFARSIEFDYYQQAYRARVIEKDYAKAETLYKNAIRFGSKNLESMIKDYAWLLTQLGRGEEGVKVLLENEEKIIGKKKYYNLLTTIYENLNDLSNSRNILLKLIKLATGMKEKLNLLYKIGTTYLKEKNYVDAQKHYNSILNSYPNESQAKYGLAVSLINQNKYLDAEKIVNEILRTQFDPNASRLKEIIEKAKLSGAVDKILIDNLLTDFSNSYSKFADYYLKQCEFRGVEVKHIRIDSNGKKSYNGSEFDFKHDIQQLDQIAKQAGTKRPLERYDYYLSAARIYLDIRFEPENFFLYLYRSFVSRGDLGVIENSSIDSIKTWYLEALALYDATRANGDEQEAVNAVNRYLFSTLGKEQISIQPGRGPNIETALENVYTQHPDKNCLFKSIFLLTHSSRFASARLLPIIFQNELMKEECLNFCNQLIQIERNIDSYNDFIKTWNKTAVILYQNNQKVKNELKVLSELELNNSWLEKSIKILNDLKMICEFNLDKTRLELIQSILIDISKSVTEINFEDQEYLLKKILTSTAQILSDIESNPTKISVENLINLIDNIQKRINERLIDLYEKANPRISIHLAKDPPPPDKDLIIELQITVENELGSSPVENFELVFEKDDEKYQLISENCGILGSLRGGNPQIIPIHLKVSQNVISSETFSLVVSGQYNNRKGEKIETQKFPIPIRLFNAKNFEPIHNPYNYAQSSIVDDPKMFFGREMFIKNIVDSLKNSIYHSKSILIYGQKRSGKSSILYHLKLKLNEMPEFIVVDVENLGGTIDENSQYPFVYQILFSILYKISKSIKKLEGKGYPALNLPEVTDNFYDSKAPLIKFSEIMDSIKETLESNEKWKNKQFVLLIDEFSYLFDQINRGKIPETFMRTWKAILQKKYFHVVLVGQDSIIKFKNKFPNEFGTTQDERVSYLEELYAKDLIDMPIRLNNESRYRERAIQRIYELTAGSAYYIQIICYELVNYLNKKKAPLITFADVERVKSELISGVNRLSKDKFDNLINSGDTSETALKDEDIESVLYQIAINSINGPCKKESIQSDKTINLDIILKDLVDRQIIDHDNGFYQIKVALFKDWLLQNQFK
jgi:TolA-binding protein